MLFKRLSLAVLVAASSQAAMASPATSAIQFQGAVKGTTCTVSVGGVDASSPSTVILEDVNLDYLSHVDEYGEGSYSGGHLAIDLKDCSGPANQVRASFQGGNGTTVSDGRLNNMATHGPASNIQLQIRTSQYPYGTVDVGGDQSILPYADIEGGAARLEYWVEYWVTRGYSAGNIEAAVEYTVAYH